jgi:hypothetical protein
VFWTSFPMHLLSPIAPPIIWGKTNSFPTFIGVILGAFNVPKCLSQCPHHPLCTPIAFFCLCSLNYICFLRSFLTSLDILLDTYCHPPPKTCFIVHFSIPWCSWSPAPSPIVLGFILMFFNAHKLGWKKWRVSFYQLMFPRHWNVFLCYKVHTINCYEWIM